jgi:MSHA pilin protein MshD
MSTRSGRQPLRGMTLIELIIAVVIISVGLAGVLAVFSTSVSGSANPVIHKQMTAIAEGMMEEIVLKTYSGSTTSATPGCVSRTGYTTIWNYNNYSTTSQICDAGGNVITALNGYSMSVSVVADATTFSTSNVTAAANITVTVSYGSQTLSLTGWRTNYAS